jgi:hypothetical protein
VADYLCTLVAAALVFFMQAGIGIYRGDSTKQQLRKGEEE